ncbi:GNAT family N-acetyltransferase [Patescibacteria group bacterium]|nr:GNAT family N-acetyltransferase [Patescibacteria group bacterium]
MPTTIRKYREEEDKEEIITLIEELQNHIASIDPLEKNKKMEDFDSNKYFKKLNDEVLQQNGIIIVAVEIDSIIGLAAGVINKSEDALDHYPAIEGRTLELIVSDNHRRKGVGILLMQAMETYFQDNNCSYARVECFAPNQSAYDFYKKNGYDDRTIDLIKKIELGSNKQ